MFEHVAMTRVLDICIEIKPYQQAINRQGVSLKSMRLFRSYQSLKSHTVKARSTVVGIGNFDGVHQGHQALINMVIAIAKKENLRSSVLTFSPHPLRFFKGEQGPKQVYSLQDRIDLLKSLGIELILAQIFDLAFASLSPSAFVKDVLIDALQSAHIVVGYDFAFGARRSGTLEDLIQLAQSYGAQVHIIEAQQSPIHHEKRPYSSTWIRELITEGKVIEAQQALGRPYHMRARVVRGLQRGRKLGFPTANLELSSELCPQAGVYTAWLDWGLGPHMSVVSVGSNPTFKETRQLGQQQWSVEVHVLETALDLGHNRKVTLDLYDREVCLWFVRSLRAQKRFSSPQDLIKQIQEDCHSTLVDLEQVRAPQWPQKMNELSQLEQTDL